jgi:precorrin-6x reductase
MPLLIPTDAVPEAELVQLPPPGALDKVVALPEHTNVDPVIADGSGFTVTAAVVAVAVALNVEHELIAVKVYTPADAALTVSDDEADVEV